MIEVREFMETLRRDGVQLWLQDGAVRYRPSGSIDADRLALLREHRAEVVAHLQTQLPSATPAPLAGPRPAVLPLSQHQQGMWFLEQLGVGGPAYQQAETLRIEGALDVAALGAALAEIECRHEILRTRFPAIDGVGAQVVEPAGVPMQVIDLGALDADSRTASVAEIRRDAAQRRCDLGSELPFAPLLLRLGAAEHLLVIRAHHLVLDGPSFSLLFRELATLYASFADGEPSPLPPLAAQYADYAVHQQKWLRSGEYAEQLAYWRSRLGDAPDALDLPLDRRRSATPDVEGDVVPMDIPGPVLAGLRRLADREGSTLFMVLLAAFCALLSRWSSEDDVSVGLPVDGRNHPDADGLLGHFLNTVVLRSDLTGRPSFLDLLRQVRARLVEAYDKRHVPLDRLVAELRPQRGVGVQPLFPAMFTFLLDEPVVLAGLRVTRLPPDHTTAMFDLMLFASETDDRLDAGLEYATSLFDRSTIERLAGYFVTLLGGVVADPGTPVGQLPLLTGAQWHRQMVEWNASDADFDTEACLHELFEAQVARVPEQTALIFEDEQLTYRELNARANAVARRLRSLGVGPDATVGISLPRSPQVIVAILAVLKAGGACVPIDPAYPLVRRRLIAEDASLRLIIGPQDIAAEYPNAQIVSIEAAPGDGRDDAENLRPVAGPQHLAWVLYTSGSSGRPKGVAMAHRPLVSSVYWHRLIGSGGVGRTLQWAALSFDVSFQEIFTTLAIGETLVLVPEEVRHDLERLLDVVVAQRIERLFMPFAALQQLVEVATRLGRLPGSLRAVVTAGEQLQTTPAMRAFFTGLPGCELHNHYGPIEAHLVTGYTLTGTPDQWPALPPIGVPLSNASVYLLNRDLEPVPPGAPGELYVGGIGLARGYYRRPDLTAERYLPNPFRPGERMYRTGDQARYREDGVIEFLGRVDFQVKVRGFRVELGEIETALATHPQVRDAVVVAHSYGSGDRRLVAYLLIGGPQRDGLTEDLRGFLAGLLPEFMVPAAYVVLERLPRTPSGKVDRRALPAPEESALRGSRPYVAPRTPMEERLAAIWAEVLGVERLGVHDDFFELGGHSLLATRVVARIHQETDRPVPLRTLFEAPTVAEFAARLDPVEGPATDSRLVRQPRPASGPAEFPASDSQRRLWFIDRMTPDSTAYHLPMAYRLRGPLDVPAMRLALRELVGRHEVLRTAYRERDGELVQVVSPEVSVDLPVESVAGSDEAMLHVEADTEPFDLAEGPVLRTRLFRLSDYDHVMLLNVHHIAFDGWSTSVLFSDLATLYDAHARGVRPKMGALPVQFADYSVWQRAACRTDQYARHVQHWIEVLRGAHARLELPTDRPRPAVRTLAGSIVAHDLPRDTWHAVERLAVGERGTPFMVVVAAFQALLARYTGQVDISVGTAVAGRLRPEVEPLVGCFVNTLVLRGDLSGDPSFLDMVRRTRIRCLDALEHQAVPFDHLVEVLGADRDPSSTPLFQAMVNVHNTPPAGLSLPGLTVEELGTEATTAKFDLVLHVVADDDTATTTLEYNADLFDAATAERMVGHFEALLRAAVEQPGRRLSELPLSDSRELALVTREWNPDGAYLVDRCLADLVDPHAAARPDAVAVRCAGSSLTYRELVRRANQLAHHLIGLGVRPEAVVGICLERSLDLVVAALAVLKAGGAYLPLDPTYPAAVKAYRVADSGAVAVITRDGLFEMPHVAVVDLGRDAVTIDVGETDAPAVPVSSANLAYVIYTSGSSGPPKAVAVTQAEVVRLLWATEADFGFGPDDVWTMFHSFAFDFAVWEMWGALAYGGVLVVVPADTARSPRDFADLLLRERVTVLNQTPSAFRQLSGELFGPASPVDAGRLAVRHVILGGEAVVPADLRAWFDRLGDACPRMVNMYGITETTVHTTMRPVSADDLHGARVPIGRPLSDVRVYVLDDSMRPSPIGVVGELYVGGAGLARGYLGAPGLTAARFVPDPFAPAGGRLYRSGDRGRWLAGGDLEYLGRADDQVKIRGHRVELGEIEAALTTHPAVRACAVLLREDVPGEPRMVAYVEVDDDPPGLSGQLRAHLTRRLSAHMIPAAFVRVRSWPVTVNGKLDRAALPAPIDARPEVGTDYEPPQAGRELALAGIWSEVLRVDRVGRHDNFFDLGGHSFIALRVVNRIGQTLAASVTVADVFQAPTIALLAEIVEASTTRPAGGSLVTELRAGAGRPLVLVHPIGGSVTCYTELVRALPGGYPVIGVSAVGADGREEPLTSVEAMAERYLAELAAIGIPGAEPPVLAGWSMGGVIAFEMARKLHARTGACPSLVIIDGYAPDLVRSEEPREAAVLARFADDWGRSTGVDLGMRAADLTGPDPVDELAARAVALGLVGPQDGALVRAMASAFVTHERAVASYLPPLGYPGDVLVLSATVGDPDVDRGWSSWTRGAVTGRWLPGGHYDMLGPAAVPIVVASLIERHRSGGSTVG